MSVAWLFPGQGSQFVGMAKDVLAVSPAARAVFERVDAALGEPLSRLILEGPEEVLTLTANAQPALVATSLALLAALRERIPSLRLPRLPRAIRLASIRRWSRPTRYHSRMPFVPYARGIAMQQAVPPGSGAMTAIMGVAPDRIEAICAEAAQGEVVAPANFNAPGQIVVAGHAGAVARVGAIVTAEKGRAIPLKVSAPFHCALMAPAARALEAKLDGVAVAAPLFPVVANFDAKPNSDASRTKGLLVNQVVGAVRWEESLRAMAASGVTHALEIGPGKVLAGLVRRIAKDVKVLSVGDAAALEQVESFLETASGAKSPDAERQPVERTDS